MRKSAPIEVVVHYPKTKEGWDELGKRVATAHANPALTGLITARNDRRSILCEILHVSGWLKMLALSQHFWKKHILAHWS